MNVFLFPGQGSQEIGMAADLFKSDQLFRDLVSFAAEKAEADLERICLRGPERELMRTRNLQPLLVCVSLGYLRHLTERGIRPDCVLGHSLGEVTALAAAGVITAEDAVALAARRGRLMDEAAAQVAGGMVAVTTSQRGRLLEWLATLPPERLTLANDNTPTQLVLSGELPALDEAVRFVTAEHLGTCRKLPVAGPWHSPLMAEAQRSFADWLQLMAFRPPALPIFFNLTAAQASNPEDARACTSHNLTKPVRWRECMDAVNAKRPTALFEVGPGRVLAGLARANGFGDATQVFSINNLRGVELALAAKNPVDASRPNQPSSSASAPPS